VREPLNASEFNASMNALRVGDPIEKVRRRFGLPIAHVPATVFEIKPGSEMRETGLNVGFPAENATEYLVYRHPTRTRMIRILGFRDGLFCGGTQQTFTSAAESFMARQLDQWRKQSVGPISDG